MKVYIAGPMTGLPELNFPAFMKAAAELRAIPGVEVVNPAELNSPGDTWATCMRRDIAELMKCNAVLRLSGWDRSRGAMLEVSLAQSVGMPVMDYCAGSFYLASYVNKVPA